LSGTVPNPLATQHGHPGATLLAVFPVNGGSDQLAIVSYLLPRPPAPAARARRARPARAGAAPALRPLGPARPAGAAESSDAITPAGRPRPAGAVRPVTAIHAGATGPAGPGGGSVRAAAAVPPADGLVLDTAGRRVLVEGRDIGLVFREFELLQFLAMNPGRALSRPEIFRSVWGEEPFESSRTVDIHVHRVRRKLGPAHSRHIVTVRRIGYRYEAGQP
jgi:Transcriptional regulatory protein, C terminal